MDLIFAMRVFARVAETESFTRAAERMDVSVPVVTRAIAGLEAHLNVRLLNRSTRRVALTPVGETYLEGCRAVLAQIEDVEKRVTQSGREIRGSLRVLAGTPFALTQLSPVLASYRRKYPNLRLQLILADRQIDFISDEVDAAIVADNLVDSKTLVLRPLFAYTYVVVASPTYLEGTGIPSTPADLKSMAFIGRVADSHGHTLTLSDDMRGAESVHLKPALVCNNALMLHQLALNGAGFAILPTVFVERELKAGSLVQLLTPRRVVDGNVSICLAYPGRKYVSPKLRTLIDHVVDAFRE